MQVVYKKFLFFAVCDKFLIILRSGEHIQDLFHSIFGFFRLFSARRIL